MPKFKVTWWESNRWEATIDAESKEDAIDKTKQMTDEVFDNCKETDDSFIESGDYEAIEIFETDGVHEEDGI